MYHWNSNLHPSMSSAFTSRTYIDMQQLCILHSIAPSNTFASKYVEKKRQSNAAYGFLKIDEYVNEKRGENIILCGWMRNTKLKKAGTRAKKQPRPMAFCRHADSSAAMSLRAPLRERPMGVSAKQGRLVR